MTPATLLVLALVADCIYSLITGEPTIAEVILDLLDEDGPDGT